MSEPAQKLKALEAENKRLRSRLEFVEEYNAAILEALEADVPWLRLLGLTAQQSIIASVLVRRQYISTESLALILEAKQFSGDPKAIRTAMATVRRRLMPYGVEIKTIYCDGYCIDRSSRDKLRRLADGFVHATGERETPKPTAGTEH